MQVLEQNLRAISDPVLRTQASAAPAGQELQYTESKDGLPIAILRGDRGAVHLHSRYGPEREADRVAAAAPEVGYLVVVGLGAAYHVEAIARRYPLTRLLVLEPHIDNLRHLVRRRDVAALFANPMVRVCPIDSQQTVESLVTTIQDDHVPALDGPPAKGGWPGENAQPARVRAIVDAALGYLADSCRDELYTHAGLADSWIRNIARNSLVSSSHEVPSGGIRSRSVVVAAAGPSLEDRLRGSNGSTKPIISTDTALPALLRGGQRPALVVSLDPKPLAAYHLKGGGDLPLVASVTASPTLTTHLSSAFIHDGHPLVSAAESLAGLESSQLPASLGASVTHGAIVLAHLAGARDIELIGGDFSYPDGKPYARGTYVYDWFEKHAGRRRPVEAAAAEMVFLRSRPAEGTPLVYRSELLEKYRSSAEALLSDGPSTPAGITLDRIPTVDTHALRGAMPAIFDALMEAPEAQDPVRAFLQTASEATARAYLACIPHLSIRAREHPELRAGARELIWAKERVVDLLRRYL